MEKLCESETVDHKKTKQNSESCEDHWLLFWSVLQKQYTVIGTCLKMKGLHDAVHNLGWTVNCEE